MILASQNFCSLSAEVWQQWWWLRSVGLWLTHLWLKRREIRRISDIFLLKRHRKAEETEKCYTWKKRTVFQQHAKQQHLWLQATAIKGIAWPSLVLDCNPTSMFIALRQGLYLKCEVYCLFHYWCFGQVPPSDSCGLPSPSLIKVVTYAFSPPAISLYHLTFSFTGATIRDCVGSLGDQVGLLSDINTAKMTASSLQVAAAVFGLLSLPQRWGDQAMSL